MKTYQCILFGFITFISMMRVSAQKMDLPGKQWQRFVDATDAGFSQPGLDSLQKTLETYGSAGFLVAVDGKIAFEWGETSRRFLQTSVRKSYMNAMIGIYAEKGKIDINSTLADLNIEEVQPLTALEKQARVIDLLAARSGIYLPAAYAHRSMKLPERGIYKANEAWLYNNWDFNVLSTIFNQTTGKDFFEAFYKKIAQPIQMEDFRMLDTYYRYEKDKSLHPAYLFKLSARDMARFGLLYLNNGKWNGKQIIPQNWVKKSTGVYTKELPLPYRDRGSYGLLWWLKEVNGIPTYYASGAGTQRIYVIPSLKMVVVHVTNNYQNQEVSDEKVDILLQQVLNASMKAPKKAAKTLLYNPIIKTTASIRLSQPEITQITGEYQNAVLGKINIEWVDNQLVAHNQVGHFMLLPKGNNTFFMEDFEVEAVFQEGTPEQKRTAKAILNKDKMVEKIILYY